MAGLGAFLDVERQRAWMNGKARLADAAARLDEPEQRLRYLARYEKLRARPQAPAVFDILRRYGSGCIPIPRRTERYWWSVSCLPSTPGGALVRVNASWMELFALYPDGGDGIRARFLLHLSDFTKDRSPDRESVDQDLLESLVADPADVGWFFPRGPDMFGVRVRGLAAIRQFMARPHALRAIRAFNLAHMNRGRNAYQGSHCYGLADHMIPRASEGAAAKLRRQQEVDAAFGQYRWRGDLSRSRRGRGTGSI